MLSNRTAALETIKALRLMPSRLAARSIRSIMPGATLIMIGFLFGSGSAATAACPAPEMKAWTWFSLVADRLRLGFLAIVMLFRSDSGYMYKQHLC